jgi:hypothetical protein
MPVTLPGVILGGRGAAERVAVHGVEGLAMADRRCSNHEATPDEVERMMRNLCAYALSEPDPLQRYLSLTHQQAVFAGVVAALQAERGAALADLAAAGTPLDKLVTDAGLDTPAQARALVKAAGRTLPRRRTASRSKAGVTGKRKPRVPLLPPTSVAPNGSRVLTREERVALGLPAVGAISSTKQWTVVAGAAASNPARSTDGSGLR